MVKHTLTHGEKMNAYEVRVQVLDMAKDSLQNKHYQETDVLRTNWERKKDERVALLERANIAVDEGTNVPTVPNLSDLQYPKFPTYPEIIEEAKLLYEFVQDKGSDF